MRVARVEGAALFLAAADRDDDRRSVEQAGDRETEGGGCQDDRERDQQQR